MSKEPRPMPKPDEEFGPAPSTPEECQRRIEQTFRLIDVCKLPEARERNRREIDWLITKRDELARARGDLEQFVELVEQMRAAQREYFQTKAADAIRRSKQLEKAVDQKLAEFRAKQGQLF